MRSALEGSTPHRGAICPWSIQGQEKSLPLGMYPLITQPGAEERFQSACHVPGPG